jgi:hypothetical protein
VRRATLALALALGLIAAGAAAAQYDYGDPAPPSPPAPAPSAATKAATSTYRAPMNVGQEVPRPKGARGSGLFTATVTESGSSITLAWKLTFKGLTGKAVAAHVHRGARGKAGPVLVPLCGPCRSGQSGRVKLSASANGAIQKGGTYVNVHTARNAAGEIRGQVKLSAQP